MVSDHFIRRCLQFFTGLQCVCVPACLVWSVHRYGCATTPDSAAYLAMARSFAETGQLNMHDGTPCALWPPLYSIVIAACSVFGPLVPEGVPILAGCLSFLFILGVSHVSALRIFRTWPARFAAVAGVAWSSTLLLCMAGLLSEVVFLPLVTLFVAVACAPRMEPGRRMAWLLGCASAATLARYAGVQLYAFAGLYFLAVIAPRAERPWRLFLRVVLMGTLSLVPVGVMIVRNVLSTGTLTGPPTPVQFTMSEDFRIGLDIVTQFFLPRSLPQALRLAALGGLMLAAVAAAWRIRRRSEAVPAARDAASMALVCGAWSAFYFLTLLPISQTRHTDLFDFRMLSPMLLPMWFMVVWLGDQLAGSTNRWRAVARPAGCVLLACLVGLSLQRFSARVWETGRSGWGMYTDRQHDEDELVRFLRASAPEGELFSNAQDAVYLLTRRRVSHLPNRDAESISAFRDRLAALTVPARIAWFDGFWRGYAATPALLADAGLSLVPERTFARGTLYRVSLAPEPPAPARGSTEAGPLR